PYTSSSDLNNVFLMEAMWTRFLPVMKKVQEWINDGKIGKVRFLTADFAFRTEVDPETRLFNPELGGGALLDVGVYTVSLASLIFKEQPEQIEVVSDIGRTGVDEQTGILLGYSEGEIAQLFCAATTDTRDEARIIGTEGSIYIPRFWQADTAILTRENDQERVEIPLRASGYNYEAEEVMNCLEKGQLESEIMSLKESLAIMKTMDKIREKIGLKYPVEEN
ncbi:MAG: Gfo/Idh/MocA family protein, partial [Bacillota bacterium]